MSDENGSAAAPPAPSSASTAPAATSGGAAATPSANQREPGFAAISAWLGEVRNGATPTAVAEKQHTFDVDTSRFQPEDQAYLSHFLNHMAKRGATQGDVEDALAAYRNLSLQIARERTADARALEEARREAGREFSNELERLDGHEFETNKKLVVDYLRGLPPAERDATDELPLADLVKRARNAGAAGSMTLEQIEHVLRTDRRRYNGDLAMQARLRDLYRARDGV